MFSGDQEPNLTTLASFKRPTKHRNKHVGTTQKIWSLVTVKKKKNQYLDELVPFSVTSHVFVFSLCLHKSVKPERPLAANRS